METSEEEHLLTGKIKNYLNMAKYGKKLTVVIKAKYSPRARTVSIKLCNELAC